MRATRFRLAAGCLSWDKKDGTAAKNQRILDVIPAQYKDPAVNSTKGWRDLNKAEKKRIKDGAMRKPQQGPKAKRAAQAGMVPERKVCPVEDFAEGDGFLEEGEGVQHQAEDAWNVAPNEQNSGLWQEADAEGSGSTMPIPQPSQVDLQARGVWQPPTVKGETFANTRTEPSNMDSLQSRKRSRGHSDANTEESTNLQAQKRARTTNDAQNHGIEGGYTRIRTSRMGRLPQQRRPAPEPPYIQEETIARLETRAAGMDAYFTPFDSGPMIQDGHGGPRGVGERGEGGGGHESRYPPVDWHHGRWDGMVHDGGSWMQDGWDGDGEGGGDIGIWGLG